MFLQGRWRGWLLNAALAAGGGSGALLCAEVAVRLVVPQQLILIRPDFWQAADTVGWAHRPNVAVRMNTGERTVDVFTDREGFRVGRAGRIEAPTRVLVLGDSYMEALQVEYEQSFPGQLQATLPARVGRPVAVRNAGVGGWSPDQYLLQTRQSLARERYDLVLVMIYVGNDVIGERREYLPPRSPVERKRFRLPRRLARRELIDALAAPVNDALEVSSHLYILAKTRLETLRMRLGLAAVYFPPDFRKSAARSHRWDVTAEVCRDLAEAATAGGARTMFVLIPTAYQVDQELFRRHLDGFGVDSTTVDVDQPSRLLGEALRRRGLHVVDALEGFRQRAGARAATDRAPLFGAVDSHLTAEGHAILADLVLPHAIIALSRAPTPAARTTSPRERASSGALRAP
jgi:hypothetical protein